MVGRVYCWKNRYWRVVVKWRGKGPRNVLIEEVEQPPHFREHWVPVEPPVRTVRPFRGLRRA